MSETTLGGHGIPPAGSPIGSGDWTVEAGDSMVSIAEATGHFWQTIWNDSANAALKDAREDPETLFPGDKVTIPALRAKTEQRGTDLVHRFKRRGVPVQIFYQAVLGDGTVLSGCKYEIRIGKRLYEGETDSDGALSCWVTPTAKTGTLTLWPANAALPEKIALSLSVGSLPPVVTVEGLRSRLRNLGYLASETNDGDPDDDTVLKRAIHAFQADMGLEANGRADNDTLDALESAHGS